MTLSLGQLTVVILLITAAVGFMRGWAADVITAAIVLGTLLFLIVGGGTFLTSTLLGGVSGGASCTNMSGSLSDLMFGGLTALGYYAGGKHGGKPISGNQRIAGIIPGAITGGAISYYLSTRFVSHAQGVLHVLNALSFLTALPLLIVLGVIGLASALLVSHNGKAAKAH